MSYLENRARQVAVRNAAPEDRRVEVILALDRV